MYIYLETEVGSGKMKYRGESNDYDSFVEKMKESGLRVVVKKVFAGNEMQLEDS